MRNNLKNSMLSIQKIVLATSVSAIALLVSGSPTSAQSQTTDVKYDGKKSTQSLVIGENTERGSSASKPRSNGYSISVDGERFGGNRKPVDVVRQTDVDLSNVDVQVKFDGLGVKPRLNVSTVDTRHSYSGGDRIGFLASTNYASWIERAELRIFDASTGVSGRPLDVVNVPSPTRSVNWRMPEDGPVELLYVLRVYDHEGRFDETSPLGIRRTTQIFEKHEVTPDQPVVAAGDGDDRTAVRNIPVYGGAVTVFGRDVPAGYKVKAIGENVPLDENGAFVIQRILPPGDHAVDVKINGQSDGEIDVTRNINIPENEWFYVGLADLTIGRRLGDGGLIAAGSDEYESTYSKGRLAFYLKGKIKGRYLLTAAADTGEDKIENLFKNLDTKDPRQVLRRIDPDKYYPVYGDDSTSFEDAPTNGKFYVRLERGDSHVMWGNYKTTIKGTEFARNERTLYGAHGLYRSEKTTVHGERKLELEAYASQPGTLPQRDNFRGTGGSVYFLTRQDLNRGSETITIELRDRVTGIIRSRRTLRYGEDYDINYTQGVIILNQPLTSSGGNTTIIDTGVGGDHQFLVAQYEYTPALEDVDGYSFGGRGQAWLGNSVRIGVTGLSENTGEADQKVLAADIYLRLGANSYAEAEIARSEGPGFGFSNSIDGGLSIGSSGPSGSRDRSANAYRAKIHIDLEDTSLDMKGAIGAYFEKREEGFSSFGYDTNITQRTFGLFAKVEIHEGARLQVKYEDFKDDAGKTMREGDAEVEFDISDHWLVGVGVKHTHLGSLTPSRSNGSRTDLGVRLTYAPSEDEKYYIFGQGTVHRNGNLTRNNRIGVGLETRLTEKLGLKGQASYGTTGWAGLAALTYDPTANDHYYFGYKLDPQRALDSISAFEGYDQGTIVLGSRHKHSDALSTYHENNYDLFGERQTLTGTYGVLYTPTAKWTVNGGIEIGDVKDDTDVDLERVAVSASIAYNDPEKTSWRIKGEARFEDSEDGTKDRDTYLLSAGFSMKHNENWRLLGNIDAAISHSDQTSILDGDYIEGSIGYAYRPSDNDAVNALFKYTYLYDLPGADQVTVSGSTLGSAQRSHILSADVSYDITERLTLGAKYGFRIGEVSETRNEEDFVRSSAHLGVLRADFHVVKKWDVLVEGRVLHTPEIDTTNYGLLIAGYRHVGKNLKVGLGYNFGRFSDDVSDLTYDDKGVFVNLVGKF